MHYCFNQDNVMKRTLRVRAHNELYYAHTYATKVWLPPKEDLHPGIKDYLAGL